MASQRRGPSHARGVRAGLVVGTQWSKSSDNLCGDSLTSSKASNGNGVVASEDVVAEVDDGA